MAYLGLMAVGALGLNPDSGFFKTQKTVRFAHKCLGRLAGIGAMTTAGLKAMEMAGVDTGVKAIVVAPLALMGLLLFV